MESSATARYLGTGHRKVEVVLSLIRGKRVEEALNILRFTEKSSASMVEKVLRSAVANANQGGHADVEKMKVVRCFANQGPIKRNARRFIPRAMGRASAIRKKTCHLTIVVGDGTASSKA